MSVPILPSASAAAAHGSPGAPPLLLRRARLAIGGIADILLVDGKIAAVGGHPAGHRPPVEILDLRGYLLIPSLAEPHVHLDKAYTAASVANPGGSLRGAIDAWVAARPEQSAASIAARAWTAATRYLAHGTTAIRAHVDVGKGIGLRALQALLDVRAGLTGVVDVEIVVGAAGPVTGRSGAANRALLRDALSAGADLVGGTPALDDDPGGAVDTLAAVAAGAATGLDLHIDKTIDPAAFTLPRLIAIAEAGFGYPITASHVVSLGLQAPERRRAAARSLARAGIGVVTLPQANLFLHGHGLGAAAPRGLTAVRELLNAGVAVAAGGDSLQDPFNPMGRADPLETASLLVVGAHLTPAEAFSAVTSAAREVMRLPGVTIAPGAPADLVAIRAAELGGAVASGTPDRIVVRGGKIVARTQVSAELAVAQSPGNASAWNLPRARCAPAAGLSVADGGVSSSRPAGTTE
jgi:cytosine deaminase